MGRRRSGFYTLTWRSSSRAVRAQTNAGFAEQSVYTLYIGAFACTGTNVYGCEKRVNARGQDVGMGLCQNR